MLYRGSVAEAGGVELVVQKPEHPYTQLLVGSIPNPNPDHPWRAEDEAALAGKKPEQAACKFVDRCPMAMDKVSAPDAARCTRLRTHRAVACFLYEGSPVIDNEDMDVVFRVNGGVKQREPA